jgi:large subunit ribosomal protein L35
MPKMKTSSTARKRIRVTGSGKLTHKQSGRGAKLEKKPSKVTRRLAGRTGFAAPDAKKIKKLLAR